MRTPPLDPEALVQRIYDSVDAPTGFSSCLTELGDAVGADCGQILLIERGVSLVGHHFYSHRDIDLGYFDRYYTEGWKDRDPRMAIALRNQGQVLSDVDVIDSHRFERSALYNEHLAITGTRYTLFSTLYAAPELLLATAFFRKRALGAFGARELARMRPLVPHLARAARLQAMSHALRDARHDLRHALDAAPTAVLMLDARGRVIALNALAERLVQPEACLCTEHGLLTSAHPDEARRLSAAIAQAAEQADQGSALSGQVLPPLTVSIARGTAAPLALLLSPLRPHTALRERGSAAARVLVVAHDPAHRLRLRADVLVHLYGLTATEAALAVALAEGHTLADFALERGCSEQTARTHLKRVLDKTGTRRQAELVRVLLMGAASHPLR